VTAHEQEPGDGATPRWVRHDEAFTRLEDVLASLPLDRAVPDVEEVLARADADAELLHRDERARKLLHEALLARPFGSLESVQRVRTEVELLTLEVEVLTERLADRELAGHDLTRTTDRLREVRARLDELRDQL
jgi:hypothetical protein